MNQRKIVVTGSCGFIGFHVTRRLLNSGFEVVGLDNMNDYYSVKLKELRLKVLEADASFSFHKVDLSDSSAVQALSKDWSEFPIIHLAAQAGVRYSLENPLAYGRSNLDGFLNMIEAARHQKCPNFIYASSSSVYGLSETFPLDESLPVNHPMSLYAATKKANEAMAHSYSHLYRLPTIGLRFFTVYGPWGRPDMAMFIFAKAISEGKKITLYNGGDMDRDFTFVDDVVESIERLVDKPAQSNANWDGREPDSPTSKAPYKIFNIGNENPVKVKLVVEHMEKCLGKKAIIEPQPIHPGDVAATFASTKRLNEYVNFKPSTDLKDGIGRFLKWYEEYKDLI